MKKVLLAGATGHLGRHIFRVLKQQGYEVRVLARNLKKAQSLFPDPEELVLADATKSLELEGCCSGVDVVVSAVGKNLSLRHTGSGSFHDINYVANLHLLQEAEKAGVKQFIYVSAFGAGQFPQLAYFKAHADFEKALQHSSLTHTILKPVALFSMLEEMAIMARKGRIGQLGQGNKLVNPIYDGDLANIAISCIGKPSQTLELGGPATYTRQELAQLVCEAASYSGRVTEIPFDYVETLLPFVRLLSRNLYDKLAFMAAVSKVNCIAPALGQFSLETYFELEPQLSS
ncbi:SDR family oxidoreductase [Pontibacter amylolyticus]|uniref:3-beta hydroxysteroid dehydrogenase n=1 Tax=Pontibacter amylolyticus TaxID=1424080 RepID=A0ABQ1W6U3_9BACT|nr:SDR family oxidoreductase [Pontibacter amylolyticus]GGG14361.1 3-beta hydroxysteroid dehydrogenase [Pontibacter amylolyticus]